MEGGLNVFGECRAHARTVVDREGLDRVWTYVHTDVMAGLAKNGGSQAVRQPKGCHLPEEQAEVLMHREERQLMEPHDEWPAGFLELLGGWPEPIRRPRQRSLGGLRDPSR